MPSSSGTVLTFMEHTTKEKIQQVAMLPVYTLQNNILKLYANVSV